MRLSILIMYTGGMPASIIDTITNCRGIVYVDEIVIVKPVNSYSATGFGRHSPKVRVVEDSFASIHSGVIHCRNELVLLIDEHTAIGPQFIGPLLAEDLNEHLIYYPEHDHPVARYSQYLGVDIDEEHFLDNIGNHNLEQMMGGFNCAFNKNMWLERSIPSSNMLAVNYQCLKNGMVIKVVKGMICKSPAKKPLTVNHYSLPVEPVAVEPQKQIKQEIWSACGR